MVALALTRSPLSASEKPLAARRLAGPKVHAEEWKRHFALFHFSAWPKPAVISSGSPIPTSSSFFRWAPVISRSSVAPLSSELSGTQGRTQDHEDEPFSLSPEFPHAGSAYSLVHQAKRLLGHIGKKCQPKKAMPGSPGQRTEKNTHCLSGSGHASAQSPSPCLKRLIPPWGLS